MQGRMNHLSPKIQGLWEVLGRVGPRYVLVGGSALSFRIGHRELVDIDLVTSWGSACPTCVDGAQTLDCERWGAPFWPAWTRPLAWRTGKCKERRDVRGKPLQTPE